MSPTSVTPSRAPLSVPDTLKQPRSGRRIAIQVVAYLVLIIFALIYIFPFLIEIGSAFKTDADANNNPLNSIE